VNAKATEVEQTVWAAILVGGPQSCNARTHSLRETLGGWCIFSGRSKYCQE